MPPAVRRSELWPAPVPVAALVVGILTGDAWAAAGAALLALVAVAIAWRGVRLPT